MVIVDSLFNFFFLRSMIAFSIVKSCINNKDFNYIGSKFSKFVCKKILEIMY